MFFEHVLLKDISESDSCMFYAKGSHRTHREYISKNDYYYSEEFMKLRTIAIMVHKDAVPSEIKSKLNL